MKAFRNRRYSGPRKPFWVPVVIIWRWPWSYRVHFFWL